MKTSDSKHVLVANSPIDRTAWRHIFDACKWNSSDLEAVLDAQ